MKLGLYLAAILLATFTVRAQVHGDSIGGAPAPVAPYPTNVVIKITGGIINADFDTLASYSFTVPDMTAANHPSIEQAEKQIPAVIKGLDGKTVRIRGFMMPVK